MEIEEGIITKRLKQTVLVQIQQRSGCKTCDAHDTCDVVANQKKIEIEAINLLGADIGDRVEISMTEGSLLKLSFLIYFMPVVALLVGAIAGSKLAPALQMDPTRLSILSGFITMGMVFGLLKWFDRKSGLKEKLTPRITRVLFKAVIGDKK